MSFQDLCHAGNLTDIQQFIRLNKNHFCWNDGLQGACCGGHLQIAELMIQKGANDWNFGLWGACRGGHLPTVELMIQKGACYWNGGFLSACFYGHLPIAQLMIQKGANDWNRGLYNACKGDHLSIVRHMIQKGATNVSDWYEYPKNHAGILYLFEHNISRNQLASIPGIQTFFTLVDHRQTKIKQLRVLLRDISCIISSYSVL